MLPERTAELLAMAAAQESDLMSNLFAFCVAATLDGTSDADRAHPINELADRSMLTCRTIGSRRGRATSTTCRRLVLWTVVAAASRRRPRRTARDEKGRRRSCGRTAHGRLGWLPEVLTNREIPSPVIQLYERG